MKNQQIKLQRPKPSPAERSIHQSIGQNLLNSKELPRRQPQQHGIDSDAKTPTETCNLNTNLPLLHQNSRFTDQKLERTVKTSIHRLKIAQTVRNFKKPIESSNKRWKTSNYRSKARTNGGKLQTTDRKLKPTVKNAENGCTSTQPHKNRRNIKNSRCGWETRFTRPHGGRLMIMSVELSARALPRQRFLLLDQLRTTLASVLHASIPRKILKKTCLLYTSPSPRD